MKTLTGYIARETEKAVAFVQGPLTTDMKPLWIPRKKISNTVETDGYSPSIQLAGEGVRRLGTPVELTVDAEFMARIGA